MPSGDWPDEKAIDAATKAARTRLGRKFQGTAESVARDALAAAAKASPVIPAPRCRACGGSGQDTRYTDQTPCAECRGTGTAEVIPVGSEARRIVEWLRRCADDVADAIENEFCSPSRKM